MSRRFTFPATTLENSSTVGKKRTSNLYRTTSNEPSGDVDVSQNRTWDSTSTNFSLSDASSERSPHHLKVIYRNSEGKVCSYPVEDSEYTYDGVAGNERHLEYSSVFFKFAEAHSCYDIIPTSTRLIVFHNELCVKKAFYALVFNGIRAAPVWDNEKNAFVGMLTVTDFIAVLLKNRELSSEELDQLMEQSTVQSWRELLGHERRQLISICPETSIREAVESLVRNHVHRLPVMDPQTGNLLYILTHKRILSFLLAYPRTRSPAPRWLGFQALATGHPSSYAEKSPTVDGHLLQP
ncbi:hypothetical protein RvY_02938-1 [Ramazzottius varieornatus]|uniref:CBS domain-containing protein n=1 Tax=Ramazzottius varieornatus TaxID=947166 RepID=A0A1D1UVW3_RAMVA|nr:hypothetical protein RvY_02938-1 [Ramazzottius varieornatus]